MQLSFKNIVINCAALALLGLPLYPSAAKEAPIQQVSINCTGNVCRLPVQNALALKNPVNITPIPKKSPIKKLHPKKHKLPTKR